MDILLQFYSEYFGYLCCLGMQIHLWSFRQGET